MNQKIPASGLSVNQKINRNGERGMRDQIADKIISSSHSRLVTDRAFREAILNGLEEYKEYLIHDQQKKTDRKVKAKIYDNAYHTAVRSMQKKIRSTANFCQTLGYDRDVILEEFRKLLKYCR